MNFDFSYQDIVNGVCNGNTEIGVLPTSFFEHYRGECAVPLRVLKLPNPYSDARYPVDFSTRIYPEVAFAQVDMDDERLVSRLMIALLSIKPGSEEAKAINVGSFTAPLEYDAVADLMKELKVAPFAGYGEVTVSQFVQQHRGALALLMFLVAGALMLAYARTNLLQRKVRQSEQVRNQIFSQSQFAEVIFNLDIRKIVDVNNVAVRLMGFQKVEELIGKTPLAVSAPVQPDGRTTSECMDAVHERLKSDRKPLVTDWLMQRPDGTLWDAETHMVPIIFGNDLLLQVTLVDITERKRIAKEKELMEQQLQHSQRLESIGRFSGAIAHDFNNLLTVINGYSELLLQNAAQDDQQINVYREINHACSRAGELTNQLLTFSRRRMVKMEPLDVNRIIADSASMFRRLLGEKVTLHTFLCREPVMTMADSGQLHQVLMNLVANARDAMPGGGEFQIATGHCQINAEEAGQLNLEKGSYIRLEVSDNGIGMGMDVQSKIFEPFFTTKGERGTGFGLATVYGIIKQCNGAITFRSEHNVGTSFTLYLPITTAKAAEVAETLTDADLASYGPLTVLVVEDEHEVRSFASLVLQGMGINVIECDSGERAMQLVRQHVGKIDLLFTDVVLGDISGIKLGEQFQSLFPGTPVLFTSGYANDEMALSELMQERAVFLAKPYSPATLLASIKNLIQEQPVSSS